MPSVTKLIRLATLPETRRAIVAASRSDALRDVAYPGSLGSIQSPP